MTQSSKNHSALEEVFKKVKTFQPNGTENIQVAPFEERARLDDSNSFGLDEALLKPVQQMKRDI